MICTIYNLILAAALLFAGSAAAAEVQLTWRGETDSYRVYAGTNSRVYFTNWMVIGTNTTLRLADLQMGTNFLTVVAQAGNETNAVLSDYGNEIVIIRRAPPLIRLSVSLQTSTNLTAWIDADETASAIVSADRSFQFFRVNAETLKAEMLKSDASVSASQSVSVSAFQPEPPLNIPTPPR